MKPEKEFDNLLRDLFISGGILFTMIYVFDKYGIFQMINSNPVWIYVFALLVFLWFGKLVMRGMIFSERIKKKRKRS